MDIDKFNKLSDKFEADKGVEELKGKIRRKEPNIFEVLEAADYEIRHSNFLAWILDPARNHGLGDAVLKPFLSKAKVPLAAVRKITRGEVEVTREWSPPGLDLRIDILIESASHVICVEVKWYSGEHSEQLQKYQEAVEAQFPELEKVYVYLTLSGSESGPQGVYEPMSHQDIADILKKLNLKGANKRVKWFIEQYLEILKGDDDGVQ